MAIPNLLTATSVVEKSVIVLLTNTLTTDILVCAANHSYHVKSIAVTNIDGTVSSNLTLGIIKSGGSVVLFASTVACPANQVVGFSDICPIFLEEGDLIEGGASSVGDLNILINYLDIS